MTRFERNIRLDIIFIIAISTVLIMFILPIFLNLYEVSRLYIYIYKKNSEQNLKIHYKIRHQKICLG